MPKFNFLFYIAIALVARASSTPIDELVDPSRDLRGIASKGKRQYSFPHERFVYPELSWRQLNALGQTLNASFAVRKTRSTSVIFVVENSKRL
jgi:hypothetical protein